jgi:hypothetical protein
MSDNDFLIVSRIKNARIFRRMKELGIASIPELCRRSNGVHPVSAYALMNFTKSPVSSVTGQWTQVAYELATALACEPEELWPDAIRHIRVKDNTVRIEVGLEEAMKIATKKAPDTSTVHRLLNELSNREKTILEARYGISGPVLKLDEIGAKMGIKKERARQLMLRAERKIREKIRRDHLNPTDMIQDVSE